MVGKKSKVVIWVSVAVLVLSGVGGGILSGSTSNLAKVGSEEISLSEYTKDYARRIKYIESITGRKLSAEELFSVKHELLSEMINDALMTVFSNDLDINVDNNAVRDYIKNVDAFLDNEGKFNIEKFKSILSFLGITEAQHAKKSREQLRGMIILWSLFGFESGWHVSPYNQKILDMLYENTYQTRIADIITLKKSIIPKEDAAPSEEDLKKFYKENNLMFYTKEFRSFSYAEITPEMFDDKTSVNVTEVDKILSQKKSEWQADIYNLMFDTELEADQAHSDIMSGKKSFEEVASDKFGKDFADRIKIKDISSDDNYPKVFTDEIFKLKFATVSKVIQTKMGWSIVKLLSMHKPSDKFMKAFKEQIVNAKFKEKRSRTMLAAISRINEEITKGKSLESAVKEFGIPVKNVEAVNNEGFNMEGVKVITDFTILNSAFSQSEPNKPETFEQLESMNRYLSVSLTNITPKRKLSFEEAKEKVKDELMKKSQQERIKAEAVKVAQSNYMTTKNEGITIKRGVALHRLGIQEKTPDYDSYPIKMVELLFKMDKQGITDPVISEDGNSCTIAVLKEIRRPDTIDEAKMASILTGVSGTNITALRVELVDALRELYQPKVNEKLLEEDK